MVVIGGTTILKAASDFKEMTVSWGRERSGQLQNSRCVTLEEP